MGFIIYTLGGLFGITGLVLFWLGYKLCRRIADATAWEPDGLKQVETWARGYQLTKWKKLKKLSQTADEDLRKMAKKAINLEIMYYVFWAACMILLAIGASL